MNPSAQFILMAIFGSFCQELLHWYDIRNTLTNTQNLKLLKSKYYWIVTTLVIITSGIATWVIYSDIVPTKPKVPFILGASFPIIFKKLVATIRPPDLGDVPEKKSFDYEDIKKIYFK